MINDTQRANVLSNGGINGPLVYDARAFTSPYYTPKDPLIDESLAMELVPLVPFEDPEGKVKVSSGVPYQFEGAHRMPKLNRYYSKLKPFYRLSDDGKDKTLLFESRFESGNLDKAVKVGEFEYDLYLKPDYGTNGYT